MCSAAQYRDRHTHLTVTARLILFIQFLLSSEKEFQSCHSNLSGEGSHRDEEERV